MALSLGIKPGSQFRIADTELMGVVSIGPGAHAVVSVAGKTFRITDKKSVEVMSAVRVSFGPERSGTGFSNGPRLVFEAPKAISILRV